MAHSIRKVNLGNTAFAQVTFTSYTAGLGGEQFNLAEFGLTGSVVNIFFLSLVNATDGTESNDNYAKYVGGGKVMLMNVNIPSQEMATNNSLNLTLFAIIQGS